MLKTRKQHGFTLIELLVVILILAILAALVVPRMVGHTDEAKRAKAMADIRTLSDSLQRFRVDTDRYPTTEEGLMALRTRPEDVKVWNGPYIERDPPADPWTNEYVYENTGNDDFSITSYGADGAPGGDGNAMDISNKDESQSQPSQ